jgi:hypothetical protein
MVARAGKGEACAARTRPQKARAPAGVRRLPAPPLLRLNTDKWAAGQGEGGRGTAEADTPARGRRNKVLERRFFVSALRVLLTDYGLVCRDSGQAVQGQGSSELEDRRSGKDGDRDQRKVEPGENLIPEEVPWAVESWWEAPGVAWPLELNASPLGGALLPPISRSEATGAAFEEAFMVPPATASAPPATDPSPPCFGVSFGSALFPRPETAPHGSPTPGPAKRELHFAECDDPVVDDKVQVRPKQGLTPSSPPAKVGWKLCVHCRVPEV